MATHSNILAWENPWTEEPGALQSMGSQRVDMTERLNTAQHATFQQCISYVKKSNDDNVTSSPFS